MNFEVRRTAEKCAKWWCSRIRVKINVVCFCVFEVRRTAEKCANWRSRIRVKFCVVLEQLLLLTKECTL